MNQASTHGRTEAPTTEASFFLLAALLAGLALLVIASQARIMPPMTILLVSAVLLGAPLFTWGPALVLALLGVLLFDDASHPLGILPGFGPALGLAEMGLIACFLTYAALAYRFHVARADQRAGIARPLDVTSALGEVIVALAIGSVVATLARWLLPFLYLGRSMVNLSRDQPMLVGFLVAAILIAAVSLLWRAIVRAAHRWGMNPLEATLFLNETTYRELRPDFTTMAQRLDRAGVSSEESTRAAEALHPLAKATKSPAETTPKLR